MSRRVVITGLGVVAPNGTGIDNFTRSIKAGKSGISFDEELKKLNFKCQISGKPIYSSEKLKSILPLGMYTKLQNEAIKYSCLAGHEAWKRAGLNFKEKNEDPDWRAGVIFGSGALGVDPFIGDVFKTIESGMPRKVSSRIVEQTMSSGAATYLNSMIGFGNIVTSNSSACSTGVEAIVLGYERIKSGKADTMLCGSCESQGSYIWAGFEAMRILCSDSNDNPEKGSRPMSADSSGFVPGTGAGALVLENLDSALGRGVKIYGEIIGGEITNGGQRNGGSITASNSQATINSIQSALNQASITSSQIDLICGHLTSTYSDSKEINSWTRALDLNGKSFPYINSLKSMIGHCLSAAGSIESVAAVLQLDQGFIHPNINLEKIHPDILSKINPNCLPRKEIKKELDIIVKANLGFGDVNSCIVLRKWKL